MISEEKRRLSGESNVEPKIKECESSVGTGMTDTDPAAPAGPIEQEASRLQTIRERDGSRQNGKE